MGFERRMPGGAMDKKTAAATRRDYKTRRKKSKKTSGKQSQAPQKQQKQEGDANEIEALPAEQTEVELCSIDVQSQAPQKRQKQEGEANEIEALLAEPMGVESSSIDVGLQGAGAEENEPEFNWSEYERKDIRYFKTDDGLFALVVLWMSHLYIDHSPEEDVTVRLHPSGDLMTVKLGELRTNGDGYREQRRELKKREKNSRDAQHGYARYHEEQLMLTNQLSASLKQSKVQHAEHQQTVQELTAQKDNAENDLSICGDKIIKFIVSNHFDASCEQSEVAPAEEQQTVQKLEAQLNTMSSKNNQAASDLSKLRAEIVALSGNLSTLKSKFSDSVAQHAEQLSTISAQNDQAASVLRSAANEQEQCVRELERQLVAMSAELEKDASASHSAADEQQQCALGLEQQMITVSSQNEQLTAAMKQLQDEVKAYEHDCFHELQHKLFCGRNSANNVLSGEHKDMMDAVFNAIKSKGFCCAQAEYVPGTGFDTPSMWMALKAAKHEAITIDDFKDNEEFIQFMLEQPELRGVVVSHASHWLTIRKQWKAQGFSVVNGQSDSLKPLRTAGAAKAWLREYHTKEDHMMFVFPAEILQGVTSRWKESDAKQEKQKKQKQIQINNSDRIDVDKIPDDPPRRRSRRNDTEPMPNQQYFINAHSSFLFEFVPKKG